VRQTLHWLVPDAALDNPHDTVGETRYLLRHAHRLHESLTRLPTADAPAARCLVVGSWGLEIPYLVDRLGWRGITCIAAPAARPGELQRRLRKHPNVEQTYPFSLLEHDVESAPLPFDDGFFNLVVCWGCIEHLRIDPEFSFYELNRVTAPGGALSLVTDNAISFHATHDLLRGHPASGRLQWPAAQSRWRLYTPPEIEELAQGTGWRIDLMTTIVADPPVHWAWWKRWRFKRMVRDLRKGAGLPDPYWNAYILAHATKVSAPTRSYPAWLYGDEKIRQLKIDMLELVSRASPTRLAS